MTKQILLFVLASWFCVESHAQLRYREVPIVRQSDTLRLSGLGGSTAPQYSNIDFDNDGRQDLLIFDADNRAILPLVHLGGAGQRGYRFAPEFQAAFPTDAEGFLFARDYNCDGIEDIFYFRYTDTGFGITKQDGSYDSSQRIQFGPPSDFLIYELRGVQEAISITPADLPAFGDVDGDGDMDIVSFGISFTFFNHVSFYKNMSQERGYGCDSLIFVLVNECFGQFSENQTGNTITMSGSTDSCALNAFWRNPRHTGSTLSMVDHDRDGAMDLVMGDAGGRNLNLITMARMGGDTLVAVAQDSTFPNYDTPVHIFDFPAAYFVDVNNDGALDCIASNSQVGSNMVTDSTSWLYLNGAADTAAMQLSLASTAFLYEDMLDFGIEAHPAFTDLNGDGLWDIVVGNSYLQRSDTRSESKLFALVNVGNDSMPMFELVDEDFGGLSAVGMSYLFPTFGDIDGDGDQDMLVGWGDGTMSLYLNQNAAGSMPSYGVPTHNYVSVGSMAAPRFFDFDGDGDLDIVAGDEYGKLNYFENTGTATGPVFSNSATNAQFGLFTTNVAGYGRTTPAVADIGGDVRIFVGHGQGGVIALGNIDGNLSGKFDTLNPSYFPVRLGMYAAPDIADIDGDSILDLVVGNGRGGLTFATTRLLDTVTIGVRQEATAQGWAIYPNPTNGILNIAPKAAYVATRLRLYDALGRLLLQNEGIGVQNLSLQGWPEGCYYLHLENGIERKVEKIILTR